MGAVISSEEFKRTVVNNFYAELLQKLEILYAEGEKSLLYFEHGIERFKTDFSRRDLEILKVFWNEVENLSQHQRPLSLSQEVFDEKYRASLSKFDMTDQFISDIRFFLKIVADRNLSTVAILDVRQFAVRNHLASPCMICANAHWIMDDKRAGWEFVECLASKRERPIREECNLFESVYGASDESDES